MIPTLLDLFAGMGGWSIGFYREGFNCTGVDIVDVGYPYRLVLSDIFDYRPDFQPDVVVASPPCTEFSTLTQLSYKKGQRGPPDPERGLLLVKEALRIIDEAKPRYWLIENVYGSISYIEKLCGTPYLLAKPWILWGNFPKVLFENEPKRRGDIKISHSFEAQKGHINKGFFDKGGNRIGLPEDFPFDPLRSWKRARIPVFLAQTLAKAVKKELVENKIKEAINLE